MRQRCFGGAGTAAVLVRGPSSRLSFLTSSKPWKLPEHLGRVRILGSWQKLVLHGSDPQLPGATVVGLKSRGGFHSGGENDRFSQRHCELQLLPWE